MLPLKTWRSAFAGLLTGPVATVEPNSAEECHVSQTSPTIQREAKVGWLARVTTRFLGMLSWDMRGRCGRLLSRPVTSQKRSSWSPLQIREGSMRQGKSNGVSQGLPRRQAAAEAQQLKRCLGEPGVGTQTTRFP
jgi:hypothetical protein